MIRSTFLIGAALLFLATPPVATTAAEAPQPSPALLDGKPIQGKVLATMNASGYTYLQVAGSQGETWVAIPETVVEVGQEITCAPGMEMRDFTSKSLDRTFASIVFSPGIDAAVAQSNNSPHGTAPKEAKENGSSFADALKAEQGQHPGMAPTAQSMGTPPGEAPGTSTGSSGAIVPLMEVEVEKAEGDNGLLVGDCFEKAAEYDKKTVRVRGKVMKVSHMIMGKNWLHIQDGSGNPMNNSHDLVVTTMDDPAVDTVVTVEGVLHANRDFGAGYRYDVIIEDAKVN